MSEETARKVDSEVKKIVESGYARAKQILTEKIDDLAEDKSSVGTRLRGGIKELLSYFGDHVETVYWQIESIKEDHTDISIIFKIKK